jgi:hypothetical protein
MFGRKRETAQTQTQPVYQPTPTGTVRDQEAMADEPPQIWEAGDADE